MIGPGSGSDTLTVRGVLDGRTVEATWSGRSVVGDPELIVAAQAVIRRGTAAVDHGTVVRASFGDLAGAAVALIRALDRVHSADVTRAPAAEATAAVSPGELRTA
jgi:hypothetical protein